jgi:predicted Fe-S protein YdhL (DUF1289 family)
VSAHRFYVERDGERIKSPCIGVCELDDASRCRGCRRTLEEIAGWMRYSAAERDAILADLDRRTVYMAPTRRDGRAEP